MTYTLRSIAEELRRLRDLEVRDKQTLEMWYAEARTVQDVLSTPGPSVPHFHFIMHYLIDADTRLKDAKYRAAQEAQLQKVIDDLGSLQE